MRGKLGESLEVTDSAPARVVEFLREVDTLAQGRSGEISVHYDTHRLGVIYLEEGELCLAECVRYSLFSRFVARGIPSTKLRELATRGQQGGRSLWRVLEEEGLFAANTVREVLEQHIGETVEWLSSSYSLLEFTAHGSRYDAQFRFPTTELAAKIASRFWPRQVASARNTLEKLEKLSSQVSAAAFKQSARTPVPVAVTGNSRWSLAELCTIGDFVLDTLLTGQRLAPYHRMSMVTVGKARYALLGQDGGLLFYVECGVRQLGLLYSMFLAYTPQEHTTEPIGAILPLSKDTP